MALIEQYIIDENGQKRVVFVDTEEKDFSYTEYLKQYERTPKPKQEFNANWVKMMGEYNARRI